MAGLTVNEGLVYFANLLYKGGTQYNLTLGLFTNAAGTLSESSVWADITQPGTGSGYEERSLSQGSFTVDAQGDVTYSPQQQWTATADWTGGDVTGYYIRNQDPSPKLVHIQYRDSGTFPMTNGRVYTVDLTVDTS